MFVRNFLVVLLFLSHLPTSSSLHEDEAGKWDWYKEKIGTVSQIVFPAHGSRLAKRKYAFVATQQTALAALHTRTGAIHWRRVFPTKQQIVSIQLYDRVLMVLCSDNYVTAWNATGGTLLWSHSIDPAETSSGIQFKGFLAPSGGGSNAATLVGLEIPSPDQYGSSKDAPAVTPVLHFYNFLPSKEGPGDIPTSQSRVSSSHWEGMGNYNTQPMRQKIHSSLSQLTPQGVLLVNPAKNTLLHYDAINQKKWTESSFSRDTSKGDFEVSLTNPQQACKQFLLNVSPKLTLVLGLKDGEATVLHNLRPQTTTEAFGACMAEVEGSQFAARAQVSASSTQLQVYGFQAKGNGSPQDTLVDTQLDLSLRTTGTVSLISVQAFPSEGGGVGVRAFIITDDGTITVTQGNSQLWTRAEGLGDVQQTTFVDLPKKAKQKDADLDPVSAAVNRVIGQAIGFQQGVLKTSQWLTTEIMNRIQPPPEYHDEEPAEQDEADGSELTQDTFGFKKVIVAATSTPTLYALHTSNGKVVWKRFLKYDVLELISHSKQEPTDVNYPRYSQLANIEIKGQTVLDTHLHGGRVESNLLFWIRVKIYTSAAWDSATTPSEQYSVVMVLSALTGEVMSSKVYPVGVDIIHATTLPYYYHTGTSFSNPFMLVDSNLDVHLYPEIPETAEIISDQYARIFFHMTDPVRGTVSGYGLVKGGKKAQKTWRVAFDEARGEKLETTSVIGMQRGQLATSTSVKLFQNNTKTGGNAFGFKYLNPNVFAVATSVPASSSGSGGSSKRERKTAPAIGLYLIDAVTGGIINHATLPHAVPPVKLIHLENFLLFHFYNNKLHRYQIGMWELFEDVPETSKATGPAVLKAILGVPAPVQSSFTSPPPLVSTKLLVFPTALRALGTTITDRGITNKMLLLGTSTERLVGLDIRQMEMPNVHSVVYDPRTTLSYNKTIHNIRSITSSPTNLESTSHVIAVGLDLFYTRVAPARTYDLLNDDFSYELLVLTLVTLFLATVFFRWGAQRRDIDRAWA